MVKGLVKVSRFNIYWLIRLITAFQLFIKVAIKTKSHSFCHAHNASYWGDANSDREEKSRPLRRNQQSSAAPDTVAAVHRPGDHLGSASGTTLVLNGWTTRSHWVRMAWRAPSHRPGPTKRYWYGVHGPAKARQASLGSLIKSHSKFGRAPIRAARESRYGM